MKDRFTQALANGTACDLTGVVFPGFFDVSGKEIPAISFSHARFSGGQVTFAYAQFTGGDANFENAQFSSNLWFGNAQFSGGDARFAGAQFSVYGAFFQSATFAHKAWFPAPQDDPDAGEDDAQGDFDFGWVSFAAARFEGPVSFENRRFTRSTDFSGARFAEAPQFHGCSLHQDTTFPPIENFRGRQGEEAVRAYRTLRLAIGQYRATAEEAMFWALEQIAARSTLDPLHRRRDVLPWLLSWAYEVASFYGLSVSRPLLLFLVSTLIAFPIYVYQPMHEFAVSGRSSDGITLREISDAETFSMRQVTRPFTIWGRFDLDALQLIYPGVKAQPEARQAGKTNPEPEPTFFWTKMTATAQSVLSLALVALFLLAVRRRFRMV